MQLFARETTPSLLYLHEYSLPYPIPALLNHSNVLLLLVRALCVSGWGEAPQWGRPPNTVTLWLWGQGPAGGLG